MALHRYRRGWSHSGIGGGAVTPGEVVRGRGGRRARERNIRQQGWVGVDKTAGARGHSERDLCYLSVDVRWNCCRMLISSSVCCHRTAKIRDILSSELLASSFHPMILNANGSGFCPPGDDLIRLTEIGGKFSFLRGVVHVPDENVDGRIFDIYHQLCFSQSVMTQI